jgi:4-amino-4-deoxy-L-arabinose transferase-like glycosyltransferase
MAAKEHDPVTADFEPTRGRFVTALLAIVVLASGLRLVFPAADPPWNPTVGIVWHDEGAWVHNARNRALFGSWIQDAWNPMYIAPVFTGLEYASFALFGVGVRQARLVSELMGVASVLLLSLGVSRAGGRLAGLIAGALAATNFVYVMYDRAALMEASMVAFMVISWYCYVRAQNSARWGWLAGVTALLAYFTKAAAAFYVAALAADALISLVWTRPEGSAETKRAARATLSGLLLGGSLALAIFVVPNWEAYRFYNWQMSVTRKPSYGFRPLLDRVTWFPVLHDLFTRSWLLVVTGTAAVLGSLTRWRQTPPAERLLAWWIVLGAVELILHDVGNERRFVFFIPALAALAALVLARDRSLLPAFVATVGRRRAVLAVPVVAFSLYVVAAAILRIAFLYEIRPAVRLSAAIAALGTVLVYATWPRLPRWLSRERWTPAAALLVAGLVVAGDIAQFVQWAAGRTYKNYAASIEVGRRLPPGTLVHGKLANGLALENRIRPIFVGRGFGNYEDRKRRDDVRYILTYIAPSVGYESQAHDPVIEDVLDAYPNRRIIMTFDVAETATGHDRAALIDKFGAAQETTHQNGRIGQRAHD